MELLLHDASIVVQGAGSYLEDATIQIRDGRILAVSPSAEFSVQLDSEARIDCSGMMLIPGLINAHNHAYQILCRGLGKSTSTTEEWAADLIYPTAVRLDDEDHYYAAVLACADAFRTGTTTMVSHMTNFTRLHVDSEMAAFRDCGIRGRVARAAPTVQVGTQIDPAEGASAITEIAEIERFLDRWHDNALVMPWVGPSGFYSCDPETLQRLKRIAEENGARFHIHLSETREQLELAQSNGYEGQVDWAYRLGLLNETTVIAHAVWINEAEVKILADTGTSVVHNPTSNMVLSSGRADVPAMLRAGVNVALATDGPASNDSLNMVNEMKVALMMHRLATLDPESMGAHDAYRMATEGGAKSLGLDGKLGRLEPGYLADIVGVNLKDNPSMFPLYDPVTTLVFCGSGGDVRLTIVDGKVVYQDGVFPTLNLQDAINYVTENTLSKVERIA